MGSAWSCSASPADVPVAAATLDCAKSEQLVTLKEFDFAASPRLPAAQIRDLAALRRLHAGESVRGRCAAGLPLCGAVRRDQVPGRHGRRLVRAAQTVQRAGGERRCGFAGEGLGESGGLEVLGE